VSIDRHIQMARLKANERKGILAELNQLAVDIGRCERTITSVMSELGSVNEKYKGPRTTRDDVAYLTVLLDCAKRKLAWEKQIASMQKRAPVLLEGMTRVLNDPDFPPTADEKAEMLRSLQVVQGALARLQPPETDDSSGTA
jgi:hypothetical protein